jgi:hypothetical protein
MSANEIYSWSSLQLEDLFYAYRKAKVDCFKFTDVKCISRKIAAYEERLTENLEKMLLRLRNGEISRLLLENLGGGRLVPKKLGIDALNNKKKSGAHGFFSDPYRAFVNLSEISTLKPEFRLIGDFPVEMHVLSALWINTVGHKFDEVLSKSAYGSRLRRYRSGSGDEVPDAGNYHIEAFGSFQPYFGPYKRWRENGLSAIRTELQADRGVIAISMDLTSFYHKIDPAFIEDPRFLSSAGIELSPWQLEFTSAFVVMLQAWSKNIALWLTARNCAVESMNLVGVPIGLSMARVIANALLVGLDRDIEQGLTPVYYGRYVDDMFLVLRDPGNINNATELLKFIAARASSFPSKPKGPANDEIHLRLPGGDFQGQTTLLLQQSKQKIFFLSGQGGLDLLGNIESQIRSVSSERRMMPSPNRLELMASAKVLTAAGHPADDADTLRKADGLAVRRLGWSMQLRSVEILARDLRQDDWIEERKKFYQFAHSHILRPDKLLDHLDYLPRLLSIAVALMDWSDARALVDGSLRAVEQLKGMESKHQKLVVNGSPISGETVAIWDALRNTVLDLAADAIVRSLRWSQSEGGVRPLSQTAIELCKLVGLGSDVEKIQSISLALRECDWARMSYKDHLRRDALRQRPAIDGESRLYSLYPHYAHLYDFLHRSLEGSKGSGASRVNSRCFLSSEQNSVSLTPYLFSTRPYSTQEVSLFLSDECVFGGEKSDPARSWARYVRAVRGVWVKGALVADDASPNANTTGSKAETSKSRIARLGGGKNGGKTLLGISSLLTTETSFQAAAKGSSDISRERYARIERLINQAIAAHPRPTHLLLPELSLPERWLETVSSLLRQSGISLIAGLDYHCEKPNLIHSEAVLVLTDDRLGFPASVQIRQPKSMPAAGEEQALLKTYGKFWPDRLVRDTKPIYMHNGLSFGVLVCSELQNMKHRLGFQGKIDCMMVLSWNQDLDTFSALVESASLDVHAHVALVNNRKYGDSRVRTPAKENYGRDLCRVRGGKNEHIVVVELDTETLRAFQSRAKRWPSKNDPFKPVPEGFKISEDRKTTPN